MTKRYEKGKLVLESKDKKNIYTTTLVIVIQIMFNFNENTILKKKTLVIQQLQLFLCSHLNIQL
jgi:hypothetical protein